MSTHVEIAPELITRLQDGEEAAFRAIYNQLHGRIYRLIQSLVKDTAKTEELLQETFVALWLHRGKLNETQPLYPYVYLTARRLTIDHFRKKLSEASAKDYLSRYMETHTNNTEETIIFEDLNRFTEETIKALPTQQQTVFTLSRKEGLSYDEIAERLHISPNTVRNHMVSALKTLKLHFSKHNMTFLLSLFLLIG
ncbi:RNA polymerase sigma factor [Parapedobacter tibetensis]|uniref:RNA polymerase sigma factor n=1 Tax=Parapedobacter tibetensis TaxID=2972951 RepID=UPI00214D3BBE|nr:RNA polymerase sigma-70 factor [Parapedobacter tibetensis]